MSRRPEREFLMARTARERYGFFEPLFALRGDAAVGDLYAARVLTWRMNARRDLAQFPELTVRAGRLFTMGLIEEILHWLIRQYRLQVDPKVFTEAGEALMKAHGTGAVEGTLVTFAGAFPPLPVYRDGQKPEEYLRGQTADSPNLEVLLEETILLSLANHNQAYRPFKELFDDSPLRASGLYPGMLDYFTAFFRKKPGFGPDGLPLIDMLRAPALASPDSLEGQLDFILNRWGAIIAPFIAQILTSLDIIREEDKPAFAGFGGAPPAVLDLRGAAEAGGEEALREFERYSRDRDWMSNVVLLAKSVYVWLHQLSVQYGREIARLDQIPDEELDKLARWGFTGLWLIGLWERSPASREIKRRMGNPEAEASAYSLYDYDIAAELGGEGALRDLRGRAWQRGIRLASDMVPNHTGIYSRWVREHPDWFVQLDHPPFPSYRFTGPDLSGDPGFSIHIEDGYWNHSDAAVVFKRVDNRTGETRYIYHGNDGTGLPWNDTAQLNYLRPDVREAVIGTIMHVASLFPIIRFDAAMTLTKRHYRRLWFPPPGTGGDIPSRAGMGMSAAEFGRLFPEEFWRQVVDRAAAEAHDTLLLAEAFWLMEGYFVRTLGMHRVYNSAFMNMLKREANAEYRQTLKNVLEFDPEVLKRFVNFMNNPDEETAVAQFGKGDKYFGTAAMLVTLPGLPMFGHGQLEGFTEKYGMEYRRAYWDETADEEMVRRHEREIFPLMRRRWLFSEAVHFTLYDLWRPEGTVDENVYAYSNRSGDERCLVIFNNVYGHTAGWVKESAAVLEKAPGGPRLVRRSLGGELGLNPDPDMFVIFRDAIHGLEYIRSCREIVEKGLQVILGAFQYHVFLDFRQVRDDAKGEWAELCRFLDGRGAGSLEGAMKELILTPLHQAFRAFFNAASLRRAVEKAGQGTDGRKAAVAVWEENLPTFLWFCQEKASGKGDLDPLAAAILEDLRQALNFSSPPELGGMGMGGGSPAEGLLPSETGDDRRYLGLSSPPESGGRVGGGAFNPAQGLLPAETGADLPFWRLLLGFVALKRLGEVTGGPADPERSEAWFDEWLLHREVERTFRDLGCPEEATARELVLLRIMVRHQSWLGEVASGSKPVGPALESLLKDPQVQKYLGFNRHRDTIWFVKERFEELTAWLRLAAGIGVLADPSWDADAKRQSLESFRAVSDYFLRAAVRSGYGVETLLEMIDKGF